MTHKNYVPYQVPEDVDRRLQQYQQRIADKRGVKVTKVTKAGDTLRFLLAVAEAAEALGGGFPTGKNSDDTSGEYHIAPVTS